MTGLVAVGSGVGFGVSSLAMLSAVGEAEGVAVGVLLAVTVADGDAVGVGVTSVPPCA